MDMFPTKRSAQVPVISHPGDPRGFKELLKTCEIFIVISFLEDSKLYFERLKIMKIMKLLNLESEVTSKLELEKRDFKRENADFKLEKSDLKRENADFKLHISDLEREKADLKRENVDLKLKMERKEAQLKSMEMEIDALKQENAEQKVSLRSI